MLAKGKFMIPPPMHDADAFYSLESHSPFAIKIQEFKNLDHPRPLGISGHLRVKNEPFSVELAILSALPALDELIITCQPFINESGKDETYLICQKLKKQYPKKIRLFYYLPEVIAISGSHISNQNPQAQSILEKFQNDIPENSVHSIAHYYNYGLVRIRYQYYVKIDADQFYLTDKLLKIRHAILQTHHLQNKRSFFKRVLGKLCNPFYPLLAKSLNLRDFIKISRFINGQCGFGLMGLNLGKTLYEPPHRSIKDFFPLEKMLDYLVSINPKANNPFLFNGGGDHIIIPVTSANAYVLYHEKKQAYLYETMKMANIKVLNFFGIFFLHYGFEKRKITFNGTLNNDYMTLKDYLNDQSKIKKHAYKNFKHHEHCFTLHKNHDSKEILHWLKTFQQTHNPANPDLLDKSK